MNLPVAAHQRRVGTSLGVGDLDGDYMVDILWRNRHHGANAVWFMNEVTIKKVAWVPAGGIDWDLIGTGKFE